MKQFIVLAAVLPLMLLFVAQYAIDQRNHAATAFVEEEVRAACEEARSAGCFTSEIRERLVRSISGKLGIPAASVSVEADDSVVYRLNYFDSTGERGLIRYKITVPIGPMTAYSGFLSPAGRNERTVVIAGTMASERLP